MDPHPASFPGKRRPAAKPAAKGFDGTKASKRPPWQSLTTAQTRHLQPKRAFGNAKNTNIPVEKQPSAKPSVDKNNKTSKPWKPSGASQNPAKKTDPAAPVTGKVPDDPSRSRSDVKILQHVSFQEPKAATAQNSVGKSEQEEVICSTPMSSAKPAVLGTPYLSAQNCSKCRLDKFELSTYWIDQIKLAESAGKHFLSAAFFRLALECHAQPFHRLQTELRRYVARIRYRTSSAESMWGDLLLLYGLLQDKLDADIGNLSVDSIDASVAEKENSMQMHDADLCKIKPVNSPSAGKDDSRPKFDDELSICEEHDHGCLEHDNLCNRQVVGLEEEIKKSLAVIPAELSDNLCEKEPEDRAQTLALSPEGPDIEADNNSYNASTPITPSDAKKPSEGTVTSVSENMSCGETPNTEPASSKSLSRISKTPKSGVSAGKPQENLKGSRIVSDSSAGRSTKSYVGGSTKDRACKIRSQRKQEEKKETTPRLCEKSNSVKSIDNTTEDQST